MKNFRILFTFLCDSYCDSFISSCILFSPCSLHRSGILFNSFYVLFNSKKFCYGFSCDRIIFLTALYTDQLIACFRIKAMKEFTQKRVCICTVLINLSTRMATHQTTDLNCQFLTFRFQSCHRNMADSGKTSCATDPETSLCFRIKVDESSSF